MNAGILILAATTRFVIPPSAATGHVPESPYKTWATAATNIQDAVDVAVNGDTVLVRSGAYPLTAPISFTKQIDLRSVAGEGTLDDPLDRDGTILDGGNACQVLNIAASGTPMTIRGFTIRNGKVSGDGCKGGGVYLAGGPNRWVVLSDSIIENCRAEGNGAMGGGIHLYNIAGVTNCIIRNNFCTGLGGGVYADGNAVINNWPEVSPRDQLAGHTALLGNILAGCEVYGNTADDTGYETAAAGCAVASSTMRPLHFIDCRFNGNHLRTNTEGTPYGVIGKVRSVFSVEDCEISGNDLLPGSEQPRDMGIAHEYQNQLRVSDTRIVANVGGKYNLLMVGTGDATECLTSICVTGNQSTAAAVMVSCSLRNALIADNAAIGLCAGQTPGAKNFVFENCTITGNGSYGLEIYALPTFVNCIFSGNGKDDKIALDRDRTLAATNCLFATTAFETGPNTSGGTRKITLALDDWSAANLGVDPKFLNAAASEYGLARKSPCRDVGCALPWHDGALDLAGNPRVINDIVDVGCFEGLRIPAPGIILLIR